MENWKVCITQKFYVFSRIYFFQHIW
jgi:hypothetical protein